MRTGILTQASNAKERTTKAEEEEKIKLAVGGSSISNDGLVEIIDETSLKKELKNQFGNQELDIVVNGDGSFIITVKNTNRKYYINNDKVIINSDNIVEISNVEELKIFRDEVYNGNSYEGKAVLLTTNIDLNGEEWEPIGYYPTENESKPEAENNKPFKGIFDGCNHEVDNFTINSEEKVKGFFGLVNDASIRNIGTGENVIVNGKIGAAGLIGYIYNGTNVYNCYNKGTVNGDVSVGGVVAISYYNNKIEKCYNSGSVDGTDNIGGIVGNFATYSVVNNCYNTGRIEGTRNWVGGVVGLIRRQASIETSYNSGEVYTKGDDCGGVAGKLYIDCTMKDCYNKGKVNAEGDYIGGVVGHNQESSMENCYNIGQVSGENAIEINSVVGRINRCIVNNCYAIEGEYAVETVEGIKVLSSEELKNASGLLKDKFKEDVNNINGGYPILYWQ